MRRRATTATLLLPLLAACGEPRDPARSPDTAAAATSATATTAVAGVEQAPVFRAGTLSIHNVVAPAPAAVDDGPAPVAVYFLVMNDGEEEDTLDAVEVARAEATLHDPVPLRGTGMQSMQRIETASIPPGEMLRFVPGGRHVMVEGFAQPLAAGDSLAMTMLFRRAGRVPVTARVVPYADLQRVIEAGAGAHAGH